MAAIARNAKKRSPLYSPWVMDALRVLKPPENISVSKWADTYRVLSQKDSASPGKWHTSRTPYLKKPMDSFNDLHIRDISFVAGTQLGKTVMEQNMIAYAIDQEPGPMLIVYPTDTLAEFTSQNRLQPMIKLSEPLREKFDEERSQRLELQFTDMYIALIGANSPSKLSSRPVQYVFFDEIDKFPKWTGAEASPLKLAEERTKTFYNRKIVKVSSPTLKTGNIWRSWERADAKYMYYVPCPHCGEYQTFKMKNLRWPEGATVEEARYSAKYHCEHCDEVIDDRQKMQMLRDGEWRTVGDAAKKPRSVAFHLSSFYSPWLAFGEIAGEFLSSKDSPETLMNFINSWLAEPWEDKASRLRSDVIMEKRLPYDRGMMPSKAQLVTCGVDVQLDHFFFAVRAWGTHMTSWLVDYGRAETWADVETAINRNYADENGEIHNVNLACIDSGYNTDEVYQFCTEHMDVAVPTKGSSTALKSRYTVTVLDRQQGFGLRLFSFDPNQLKDYIAGRLAVDAGADGSWNVCRDVEQEYCDQVCAEQKVERKDKKGRVIRSWEKTTSHAQNHYLDCETNNVLAAEILGVRYLQEEERLPAAKEKEPDDWLGSAGKNWF
ncbi:MAG: phage terminase large subunit family protein [Proteobacteria bacterium]|nr:phage terminase large subunit family protein [Pseudomonadota bacterium]